MALLDIVQDVAGIVGLPVPNLVASSTDKTVQQLFRICCKEVEELSKRGRWQDLTKEYTFVTVATETQFNLSTITDFKFIINDTIWNRSLRRPVFGPLAPRVWQQLKAQNMQGPWNQYRIRQNNILFIPPPVAGQNCYFEYLINTPVTNAAGNTFHKRFLLDTDVALLDEELIKAGVMWRYKQAKGLSYAEDFQTYELMISDAFGRDGGAPNIDAGGTPDVLYPGILVPSGNWFHN